MIDPLDSKAQHFALEAKELGKLRQGARENSPEALRETAKQFEAMFMNMLLKSMREATPQDGMFDNDQTRMYTAMLDQQLSQTMASRGVGLADVLIRQLSSQVSGTQPGIPALPGAPRDGGTHGASAPEAFDASRAAKVQAWAKAMNEKITAHPDQPEHVRAFQQKMAPHAEEASGVTGIPARFILGQAALESGWGRREITSADGANSFNLFGIKATGGWTGKVAEVATTEYVNGVPQRRVEKFRAYDSYAHAFRDYAQLLSNNPRYQNVVANPSGDAHGFAWGLQRAGYATDPNYANKLIRIINNSLSS